MRSGPVLAVRALAATAAALCMLAGTARADRTQESFFQDDDHLIYASSSVVDRTLAVLRSLGVDRIRVTVKWSAIAPASGSRVRPRGFNARDPTSYQSAAWIPYDRVVTLAALHGIGVEFNLTGPGPLWAMRRDSPTPRAADHWMPSAAQFGQFVEAVGRRFSGRYGQVPRISDWSVWNEPNQPGWLAPQWHGARPESPLLYRGYVDAAVRALRATGHEPGDTVLVGELAPAGFETPGFYTAMTPIPFVRALFCIDQRSRRLRGRAAAALGCPPGGPAHSFVSAHPGLFAATGFAHHPYDFFHPPPSSARNPDFAPLANLGRLELALDRAAAAYGVRRRIPIYLTEYGYQTNPPDPFQIFSPHRQAAFLNEADYLAWRDPRVRSVAQFLLYDSLPDSRYPPADFSYWDTFQTGLAFAGGRPKPAFAAYRMPIWIPVRTVRRGQTARVWGQLRPAPRDTTQRAQIQWRSPHGAFRTIANVTTRNPRAYLTTRIRAPGSGQIRIQWRSPTGTVLTSRAVPISVR